MMPRLAAGYRGAWLAVVASLVLSLGRPARAEDPAPAGPPPEAKKAFSDGKAAYERGDYEAALVQFQRAALIAPAPSLYYNIGMAYERLARFEDSALAFERYLQLVEAPQTDDERTFQTQLRERAVANHARAKHTLTEAPPRPLIEPPPSRTTVVYVQDPHYPPPPTPYVAPTPYPAMIPSFAPTPQQRLDTALRLRRSGIALTVIGGTFGIAGGGLIGWAVTASNLGVLGSGYTAARAGVLVGGTVLLLTGVPMLIPGIVYWARGQRDVGRARRAIDEQGAAVRKASFDDARPPMPLVAGATPMPWIFGAPVIRF